MAREITEKGQLQNACSIVGPSSKLNGQLKFNATLVIKGRFDGDILGLGNLIIDADAHVEGTVKTRMATIKGRFTGKMIITESVEILAPADFTGFLETPLLKIAENVIFDGECKMVPTKNTQMNEFLDSVGASESKETDSHDKTK